MVRVKNKNENFKNYRYFININICILYYKIYTFYNNKMYIFYNNKMHVYAYSYNIKLFNI